MKQIISSRPSLLRSEFTGETTNSAAYNLLVFWCNFYCYSVDSCHCICCDTYSLLPALIFTMLCECFLGHKTYWLSRTQMFNSVCVSSLRNVAVASFMGVFSADSYILFLVWCKLEQNKGKRKGRGRRLAVFDVCTFALLYTIVNYAKMVYEMPNWQCVLACRSF